MREHIITSCPSSIGLPAIACATSPVPKKGVPLSAVQKKVDALVAENIVTDETLSFVVNGRKSIEHYLEILMERKEVVTEYDVFLWHGMVEFVTVYSKDDIRFTMKDGTEIRV